MVALFQTPKCERCELGGAEAPSYWSAFVPGKTGYRTCLIFKEKPLAERWQKYLVEYWGKSDARMAAVVLADGSPDEIEWERGVEGMQAPPLVNREYAEHYVCDSQAIASNFIRRCRFVVKP